MRIQQTWVGLGKIFMEPELSDGWIIRLVGFPLLDAFKQRLGCCGDSECEAS